MREAGRTSNIEHSTLNAEWEITGWHELRREARLSEGRLARVALVAGAVLPRSEARTQWQVGGWLALWGVGLSTGCSPRWRSVGVETKWSVVHGVQAGAEAASIGGSETAGTRSAEAVPGAWERRTSNAQHRMVNVYGVVRMKLRVNAEGSAGAAWRVLSADGGRRSGSRDGGRSRNGDGAENGRQRGRVALVAGVTGAGHPPGA